jgi:hypothetical protein
MGKWSDWNRGSRVTRAGGAEQLKQRELRDWMRPSGATGVGGAERLK